jgi:uncharacterized protein YwqG
MHGGSTLADDFPERLRWPAARFSLSEERSQDRSRSHFGGVPEVPAGFEWPLDFLFQIDLAEISGLDTGLDLPRSGRLLFFYDTETQPWGFRPTDRGSSSVIFIEKPGALFPMVPPGGTHSFPWRAIIFDPIVTIPDAWSPWADSLCLTAEDRFDLNERTAEERNIDGQIGGHPSVIQNSMELECELVSTGTDAGTPAAYNSPAAKVAELEALNWRLLAQLPGIEDVDLMWGDGGLIYFWIKVDALKRRDFSRTWLILQCY